MIQYTDKQIEEAVEKAVVQNSSGTLVDLAILIMRMVREELANRIEGDILDPLPEFWKEPEETPKPLAEGGLDLNKPFYKPAAETIFGGVDVSNRPLTGEKQCQGWRPIESAPAECVPVFVKRRGFYPVVAINRWNWMGWRHAVGEAKLAWEPTHWMPIPQLPEDKNG